MKQSMLKMLNTLKPNLTRKEYEMGDWIQLAVDNGLTCKVYPIASANFNLNTQKDIELAEAYLKTYKRSQNMKNQRKVL